MNVKQYEKFGFSYDRGGVHLARTIMLRELSGLLDYIDDPAALRAAYIDAISKQNILGKRSGQTRQLTMKYLTRLYALDPSVTLFRALRYYWARDDAGRPLLALLCAYARDSVLRLSVPLILAIKPGTEVGRERIEGFLDDQEPGRFSTATLKSATRNIRSSWTQSGHLSGRVKKIRTKAAATPGAAAYALLLGYLQDARGEGLFNSEYAKLLDVSPEHVIELAAEASQRGWMVFKRVGAVMEVAFPNLLSNREMEWIREPNQAT
jgi:hypothetical protein